MKVIDSLGRPLNAEYSVETDDGRLALILESSSGRGKGRTRRNGDYGSALELLLDRLKQQAAVLVSALVDSRNTRSLPVADRRLIDKPVELAGVTDIPKLCKDLRNAQRPIGRKSEATTHGNSVKRIRLILNVPGYGPLDHDLLAADLATADEISAEEAVQIFNTMVDNGPTVDSNAAYLRCLELVEHRAAGNSGGRHAVTASKPIRLQAARRAVVIRSGGRCENPDCGKVAPDVTDMGLPVLEVDHVEDIAKGGRDHPEQMIALCPNCHAVKTRGRTRHAMYPKLLAAAAQRHKDQAVIAGDVDETSS
ncbi:HNH endonuclease [Nocardia panacis]|uniref:HNH endonuclease n=1 Tax=Nocardia panacis TaxID=2340916 RepID=A0A3A4KUT9_9NOCA|nr:HNH endonuclease signature motif containing protein [Nocardia panacis]RJO78861.1 HNH endonuclease [Nocardia panacis]